MHRYRLLLLLATFSLLAATVLFKPGRAKNPAESPLTEPAGIQGQGATKQDASGLDPDRVAALRKLSRAMKDDAPVVAEEIDVLNRFAAGQNVSEVEADAVISRALYDFYGRGIGFSKLSAEQQTLLLKFKEATTQRFKRSNDFSSSDTASGVMPETDTAPDIQPAVVPANDQCAGAFTIPGAGPFPVAGSATTDVTDATVTGDPPAPSCQSSISRSVWYTFTPAVSQTYRVTTCADGGSTSTVDDTVMAIYTSAGGCAGPFTELATTATTDGCDDDTCVNEALQSVIDTALNAGQTYYIVIWKFGATAPAAGNTAVQPIITPLTPAPNDTCANPKSLELNIPFPTDTSGAGVHNDYELVSSGCFSEGSAASSATGRDVVYSFTAPATGEYSFRAWQYLSSGASNVVLYLSDTCPAAGGSPVTVSCTVAVNRQASTGGEEINCVSLMEGQQVFLFVDEDTLGAGGVFYALVEQCGARETEPNDTPGTATALSCGIQGQVIPSTEADFYSIGTPAAGSRLFAMVDASTAGPSADLDLRVTNTTDTIEYDDADAAVQFGVQGFAPSIAGTIAGGAALFYEVDRFGPSPSGESSPYRLYSVVQPPLGSANAESEPNDTLAQNTNALSNYFYGALAGPAPSTDVDIYGLTAAAGDLIMVNLDGDPQRNGTPVDTRLALLDSSGNVLVDVNGSTATATPDNGNPASLFETVPALPSEALLFRARTDGIYYVRVTPAVNTAAGVGDYLLSISKNCTIGGGGVCKVTAPANITKTNDPNQCGAVVNYPAPTTSGTCGAITCTPASGSFFPKGTTQVICSSTSGASDSFNITVNDTQAPVANCPANVVTEADVGLNTAVVNYPASTSTDNCPAVGQSFVPPSGSTFPIGTTTVTKLATDGSGNTANCSFTVTVNQRQLAINDVSVTEGDSGSTNAVFTVTLTPVSAQTVTVDYFTANGSATEPSDYTSENGTLTFPPGVTTRTISVPINGDTNAEGTENFFVNLTNPFNAILSDAQGLGTINDNEPAPATFKFSAASFAGIEACSAILVPVTRTGNTSTAMTVKYQTTDGSASSHNDYTYAAGTLTFAPGETSKTIPILISEDSIVEGAETLTLSLSSPNGGAALGSPATATVVIIDDLTEPVANAIDDTQIFVCQQYHDFLNREPDAAGLAFWVNNIESCGTNAACREVRRIDTSAAFLLSIEFRETGFLVTNAYKAAYNRRVQTTEFLPDAQQIGAGVIVGSPGYLAILEANKQAFFNDFVTRPQFTSVFGGLTNEQFVDVLNVNTGGILTTAERNAFVNGLNSSTETRATVLRKVTEDPEFMAAQQNSTFVLMEYIGYLRRDADVPGFLFWLNKLNSFGGDWRAAEMVKAFLASVEYRQRFGNASVDAPFGPTE